MLAEASVAEAYVAGEIGSAGRWAVGRLPFGRVPDVDVTLARAYELGAEIARAPRDEPYGRTGAMVDPFGRRWLVQPSSGGASDGRHRRAVG